MTAAELSLRDALDRIDRQEQKLESIEQLLFQFLPLTPTHRVVPEIDPSTTDTKPVNTTETPRGVPWPTRREAPAPVDERSRWANTTHSSLIQSVLSSLDDVIWSVSPDAQLVFFLAGAVERTYGRSASVLEANPGSWLDAVPGEDRDEIARCFARLPEFDKFEFEHRIQSATGQTRWVVSRGTLCRGPDGRPLRVDGVSTDVTARTRTGRLLAGLLERVGPVTGQAFLIRAIEELARGLDARAALIVVPDAAHPVTCASTAAWLDGRSTTLAFSADGAFTRNVLAGVPKLIPARARDHFPRDEFLAHFRAEAAVAEPLIDGHGLLLGFVAIVDDRPRTDAKDIRTILRALTPRLTAEMSRSPDLTEQLREFEAKLAAAEHRAETAEARVRSAELCVLDAHEQAAAAEARLKQARRLETVGRLVAGVSHDINNLLTVISGHAELVQELLPPNAREPADLIVTTARTAAGVARQLVAFGRSSSAEPIPVDINAAVRCTERLLHRVVGDKVELDFLLTPSLPLIRIDPGQFDQVLLNLVANARDAIPDHGMVTVRTALAEAGPGRANWPEQLPTGRFVALTVTDTGIGMTEEVKDRIFDVYYTTKGERGTGLGLANVADIVRGAGGHIEVESSPAWGTTVRVFWPIIEKSKTIAAPPTRIAASGETVLVVQDDEQIRGLTVMAFQQAGYRVLEAADGDAAEDRARLYAGTIHLLVADLGIPKDDGRDLANRLRTVRPELNVLFVSGSTPEDVGDGEFLAKPYSPHDLLAAARRIIESS